MGIVRFIHSLKAADMDLQRENVTISPVNDINQAAALINDAVIKDASEAEREALKNLFAGRMTIHSYTTENGQYTISVVKHCRWINWASHKVYLIDNLTAGSKTAFKGKAFFYPAIRKAVNSYLYKPGERIVSPKYRGTGVIIAAVLCITTAFTTACSASKFGDDMVRSAKSQRSMATKYTATKYEGNGYTISLSDDWEQKDTEDFDSDYDLAFSNSITLGSEADTSDYSIIFTSVINAEGYTEAEMIESYLSGVEGSESFEVVSSPELVEKEGRYSSWYLEIEELPDDDYGTFYRMDWLTSVGDKLYCFKFGSFDESTYEKLKEDVKTSFSLTDYDEPLS